MSEAEIPDKDETLQEILKWVRFANFGKLRETLETELDTEAKKTAYDNSDGANGLKELAVLSGAPQDTIYLWWQKWFRLGLVTESRTRKGRLMKIVSLEDIGLKVTKGKVSARTAKNTKRNPKTGENEAK
ncbi:MAG: hypothetical protein ABSE39_08295 [Candidatus Bathyarchaeia archaeon]